MIVLTTVSSNDAPAKLLIAEWATADDRELSHSYRSIRRQSDFLLARSTLRALLAKTMNLKDCLIRPDAHGKPFITTRDGKTGPSLSLSHTYGLVACTVSSDVPVGVDVEFWRERDFRAIADYAFGPEERHEVLNEGGAAFYRIWTAREAISKIDGQGVLATLDGKDRASRKYIEHPMAGTQLLHLTPAPNYTLALAIANLSHTKKDISLITL